MPLIHNTANRETILCRHCKVPVFSIMRGVYLFILSVIFLGFSPTAYSTPVETPDSKQNILIVHQGANKISQQLIQQLQNNTSLLNYNIQHAALNTDSADELILNKQQLIIAIGSKTTKSLLDAKISTPVLSILMPGHLAKSLQKLHKEKKNWSSLVIDQPLERSFHLITAIIGKNKKTGVLLGAYTKDLENPLKRAAKKARQSIKIKHISDPGEISRSLNTLNNSSNILLTLPDPVIYNKNTIRGILLSTYRKKIPIIGFSKAYVKAGAIAAVYSKPEQISKQAASIADTFLKTGSFKKKTYQPNEFSIALNKKLAKSLGIKIKSEPAIVKQIIKAERRQ